MENHKHKRKHRNDRRFPGGVAEPTETPLEPSSSSVENTWADNNTPAEGIKQAPFFMYYVDEMQRQMHITQKFIRHIATYSELVHCILKTIDSKNQVIASMYEEYWPNANEFRTAMEDMTYLWSLHQEDMAKLQPCIEEYVDQLEEMQKLIDVHTEAEVERLKEENVEFHDADAISYECKWTQTGGKKPVGEFLLQWHCRIPKTARGLYHLLNQKGKPYTSNCLIHLPIRPDTKSDVTGETPLLMESGSCEKPMGTKPLLTERQKDIAEREKIIGAPVDKEKEDENAMGWPGFFSGKKKKQKKKEGLTSKDVDSLTRCCSKLNIATGKYRQDRQKPESEEKKNAEGNFALDESNFVLDMHVTRFRPGGNEKRNTVDQGTTANLSGGGSNNPPSRIKLYTASAKQSSRKLGKVDLEANLSERSLQVEDYPNSRRRFVHSKERPTRMAIRQMSLDNTSMTESNSSSNQSKGTIIQKRFTSGGKPVVPLVESAEDIPLSPKDLVLKSKLPVLMLSRIQFLRCCVGKHLKNLERLHRELAKVTEKANEILYDLPCYNPCVFIGETICNHPTHEEPQILQLWDYYPEVREECCRRSQMFKGRGPNKPPPIPCVKVCRAQTKPSKIFCEERCSPLDPRLAREVPRGIKPERRSSKSARVCGDSSQDVCLEQKVFDGSEPSNYESKEAFKEPGRCKRKEHHHSKHRKHRSTTDIIPVPSSGKPCTSESDPAVAWYSVPMRPKPARPPIEVPSLPNPQVRCYYPNVNP